MPFQEATFLWLAFIRGQGGSMLGLPLLVTYRAAGANTVPVLPGCHIPAAGAQSPLQSVTQQFPYTVTASLIY